jgi:hypothetical protein
MRPNRSGAWRPPRRIAIALGLVLLGLAGAAVAATTLRGGSPRSHLSAPRGFTTRLDGASSVKLSWHKPSSGTVDGYRVFRDGRKIATVGRTDYVDRGLSSLTRYVYSVRAFHGGKVGPISADAAVRTPDPPTTVESPYPPTDVFAKAGKGSALVRWHKPESNGGKPITSYIVTAYVSGTAKRSATVGNVTSTTIDQLVNGTKYTFKVAAKNTVGTGEQSAASNPVKPQAKSGGGGGSTGPTGPTGGGPTGPSGGGPTGPTGGDGCVNHRRSFYRGNRLVVVPC